jgi:glycosyltransferase involved in cell wall biosynthesis
LFASNQDTKDSLRELVSPSLWERGKVTYTAINPDEIAQAKSALVERDRLLGQCNLPTDKFLVFCVGQFIDRKGRWTFLDAARCIRQKHSDVAFVWISNSDLTVAEFAKIDEYNLGEDFKLIEANKIIKDRQQLLTLIGSADLFVLASLVEGLPIALLEAMALEIACISTSVNAIPEAVRHLETGWLIKPGDPAALAAAITKLKNDAKLRLKLAKAGRERVLENFTESVSAQTAIAEYRASLSLEAK